MLSPPGPVASHPARNKRGRGKSTKHGWKPFCSVGQAAGSPPLPAATCYQKSSVPMAGLLCPHCWGTSITTVDGIELGSPTIAGIQDAGPGHAGGSYSIPPPACSPVWVGAAARGHVVLSPGALAPCWGFPSSPCSTQTVVTIPWGHGLHPEDRDAANPASDTPLHPALPAACVPAAQHLSPPHSGTLLPTYPPLSLCHCPPSRSPRPWT